MARIRSQDAPYHGTEVRLDADAFHRLNRFATEYHYDGQREARGDGWGKAIDALLDHWEENDE